MEESAIDEQTQLPKRRCISTIDDNGLTVDEQRACEDGKQRRKRGRTPGDIDGDGPGGNPRSAELKKRGLPDRARGASVKDGQLKVDRQDAHRSTCALVAWLTQPTNVAEPFGRALDVDGRGLPDVERDGLVR